MHRRHRHPPPCRNPPLLLPCGQWTIPGAVPPANPAPSTTAPAFRTPGAGDATTASVGAPPQASPGCPLAGLVLPGVGRGVAISLGEAPVTVYITSRFVSEVIWRSVPALDDGRVRDSGAPHCRPEVVDHGDDASAVDSWGAVALLRRVPGVIDGLTDDAYRGGSTLVETLDLL